MRHLLRFVLLLTPLGLSPPHAQTLVSADDVAGFQGTWALNSARSDVGTAERRVFNVTPEELQVELERPGDQSAVRLTYKFDGSDTVTPFGKGTATSRLAKEGKHVVTETVFTVNDAPVRVNERLLLNAAGTELTVETMLRVEHGYQGVRPSLESNAPNVSKAIKVFTKQ